jgi:uncharacterized protein
MHQNNLKTFRKQKNTFFKQHPQSPLTPEQRKQFTGLDYFPPHPGLDLDVEIEEFTTKETVQMQTSTGSVQTYLKFGRFQFEVDDETVELVLYYSQQNGHFFLPFMDATNGTETYSAGRYLDPQPIEAGRFHIDFNLAYAPYCAYNDRWTCPIPPMENRLTVRIEAGEKKPDASWAASY